VEALCAIEPIELQDGGGATVCDYLEPLAQFLTQADPPTMWVFPELLPEGVLMLMHGEPRARKSLAAFELALAAATGTAPFGLARFAPDGPVVVVYVQEEDSRALTRPRMRGMVNTRCTTIPDTLHVAVRTGINLDDPAWAERLTGDCKRLGAKLIVLDAARRLSSKTDEGPSKTRELVAVLRSIVTATGAAVVVVHHDVKPAANGQDQRRRSQRASGGDWFAACECPVHVEKIGSTDSLVYPEDYKHGPDPRPFTFACELTDGVITKLVGQDTTTEQAETAGASGKLLAWLKANGPASKSAMKKAGLGWEAVEMHLSALLKAGKVDAGPGRKAGTYLYFVVNEPSS
jgi:hypothetical protein